MAQLSIRIDSETRQEFVTTARIKGTDASTVIRNFVDEYIEKNKPKATPSPPLIGEHGSSLNSILNIAIQLKQHIGEEEAATLIQKAEELKIQEFIQICISRMMVCGLIIPKEFLDLDKRTKHIFLAGLS